METLLPFANAGEHLLAELGRLELVLQREILLLRATSAVSEEDFLGTTVSDARVDALLAVEPPLDSAAERILPAVENLTAQIALLTEVNRRRTATAALDLPLGRLQRWFELTPFELDLLLLAAAPELDLRYETLFAYVQNDVTRKHPTIDLALKLFAESLSSRLAHYATFRAGNPLIRYALLTLWDESGGASDLARTLKLDRRVVEFLLGNDALDDRLLPFVAPVDPAQVTRNPDLPVDLLNQLRGSADQIMGGQPALLIGARGMGKLAAAADLGALLRVDLRHALAPERSFASVIPILWREAILSGAGLYFDHAEALAGDHERALAARLALASYVGTPGIPVFFGSAEPLTPEEIGIDLPVARFEFPLPDLAARRNLWTAALSRRAENLAADVDAAVLANKFTLTPRQIERAIAAAERQAALRGSTVSNADDLHSAARAQSSQDLSRLAQKVEPFYRWEDLVLPAKVIQQLQEICAAVKYRHVVYRDWGFERKLALGRGLNVLFSGASGTGKTMSAQVIARDLQLDLYKIDLSAVVSKYIGETEKNLSRIFAAAQTSGAILFFDEADALFGKRSEVKDAHDRYANVETAYLLQKMEEYEGIVMLATNLSQNLDDAFARRMQHAVEFPFPDADYRERIWRAAFPPDVPMADDVNLKFIARQFELAGGNIRNVALAASFLAAQNGGVVTMPYLVRAVAREYQKIGKLPSQADFRNYYDLIREQG